MNACTDERTTSDLQAVAATVALRRFDAPHAGATDSAKMPAFEDAKSGPISESADNAASVPLAAQPLLELEEPTPEMIAAVCGESLESRREQLELQTTQLAGHLRERLREVDRREAAVNARAGQLEADIRASRLWLQEREIGFQERERQLRRQIEELQERFSPQLDETPAPAQDYEAQQAEMMEREQQLRVDEDAVRERRYEVEREAIALRHAQQMWQQQREREERALVQERENGRRELQDLTEQREAQLRAAEVLLTEHVQQFEQDRAKLLAERRDWDERKERQQQLLTDLKAAADGELADERSKLEARQEWIERQKAGLEQVRDEALALHRQSLETRLIAEQLWAQIGSSLTPAEATHSIAQLRIKLAEQYRLEEQQLATRREELLKVGEAVTQQHAELEQLRSGIREWVKARQDEIERQAASLVERELALDAQQDEHRRAEREWQAVRRKFEQQIRDLTTQLRTLPVAA